MTMPIDKRVFENLEQSDRFYPEEVPSFDMEPIKTYFMIVKSPEEIKEGIITLISFKDGDLICKWTGMHLKFQTLHSLQHTEDKIFIHDTWFIGKLLHSCDPNCKLDMDNMQLYAIKDIKPFDKLTVDYDDTEKKLYQSFHCNCGAANCKGFIDGYGVKNEN